MMQCPTSGLVLPRSFIDEKQALKKTIDEWLEKAINTMNHVKENYFLTFHAKFNPQNPTEFMLDAPKITFKLPPFVSNSMVFWVSPKRGLVEMLWIIPAKKKGGKLQVEFNKTGVAYLQAKGAMPS